MSDPRDALLDRLESYARRFPAEKSTAQALRDFVRSSPDCFRNEHPPGHVTGSAFVVTADGARTLLTHHRKLGKWLQLGGHSDGEPRPLLTSLREATEESGLSGIQAVSEEIFDIDIHSIPARGESPAHLHYDIRFLLRCPAGEEGKILVSEESHDLRWVTPEGILELTTEETMLRMRRKWLDWLGAGRPANI